MNRTEFLKERQKGIGGSDIGALVGVNKWQSPLDVYLSKIDPIKPEENIPDYLHFGNVLEDVVAAEFSRRSGMKVQKRNQTFVDNEFECLRANIDRYVVGGSILECKTASAFNASEFGEDGTDEVPEVYLCQCQFYMKVTGIHSCYLAALIGGNMFKWYKIPYKQKLADYLAKVGASFWKDHVEKRVPPPPVNSDDLVRLYESGGLSPVEASPEVVALIESLKHVKEGEKSHKERRDALELEIKKFLGNHDALVDPDTGDILATWRASTSRRFDSKAFKAVEPELYKQFTNETTSRRFLLK